MEKTDYSGGFVYKDGHIDYYLTSEGRMKYDESESIYHAEYFLKDHLGNVRVVLNTDPERLLIAQITDYYPFGGEIPISGTDDNQIKYNSKELQTEAGLDWYDFHARYYDPALGRWHTPDPLAEVAYDWSPYRYGYNNPIKFNDPTGLLESTHIDEHGNVIAEYDDGDDGVYVHSDGTSQGQVDKQRKNNKNTGGDGTHIGELGGVINADGIYANTLEKNTSEAESTYNPFTFKNNVKTNGKWDLKNNKNTIYGLANDGKTSFSFKGELMESQDIGNHHFGAVAEAYGLFPSEAFVLKQAGAYQIKSGTSKPEWQKYKEVSTTYTSPTGMPVTTTRKVMLPPYGDDPRDQKWIKSGFQYYKTNF